MGFAFTRIYFLTYFELSTNLKIKLRQVPTLTLGDFKRLQISGVRLSPSFVQLEHSKRVLSFVTLAWKDRDLCGFRMVELRAHFQLRYLRRALIEWNAKKR